MDLEQSVGEFDLQSLNVDLNRSKRRLAVTSVVFAIFCLSVVLILVVSYIPKIQNGSISALELLVSVVGVVVLSGLAAILVWGLRWKRPGAYRARVGPEHLELAFPDDRQIRLTWSDPSLRFDLQDYSDVRPGLLSIQGRHFLQVEGFDSALSPEAYRAIEQQVAAHGLSEAVRPASGWRAPSGVKVHSIRARSP